MSLYRKYRPQRFSELVGQDHIRQTLTNAIRQGKFSHAYLFWGPKGSGKTSTARLLAKSLNCKDLKDLKGEIEPCGICSSCEEISLGRSMDVIEIDAASNRGIDEIRELRERIKFAPTNSKFKIYVIDECHMLTKEAFNALLKTLEEPPKHAIFILATTELHKVPATILSRTQVYDFKKAKPEEIMQVLQTVVKAEGIKIDQNALTLMAHLAMGAYRDALSLLEQVSTLEPDKNGQISLEQIRLILGQSTEKSVWDFIEALAQNNRAGALKVIEEQYSEGSDLENFISETVKILRKVVLAKAEINSIDILPDELIKMKSLAEKFSLNQLLQIIDKLLGITGKVKTAVLGQLPLEMAVFELTQNNPKDNLIIKETQTKLAPKKETAPQENEIVQEKPVVKEKPVENKENAEPETTTIQEPITKSDLSKETISNSTFLELWPKIIAEVKEENNVIAAMLRDAKIKNLTDESITLATKVKFQADQICTTKNRKIIEDAINKFFGKQVRIDCMVDKTLEVKKPLDGESELLNDTKAIFELE